MTLKELLSKLPIEVQEHVRLKVNLELKLQSFNALCDAYYYPNGWAKDGYYPNKQDIDF